MGKEMIAMALPKKSFLLYFDNYPMLVSLPPEQRGWVVTALMVFADRVWRDSSITLEEIMEQFPQMSSESRLVCGFMGGNILRDTQRWLSRQQRQEAQKKGSSVPDPEARVKADMELARRALEQSRGST